MMAGRRFRPAAALTTRSAARPLAPTAAVVCVWGGGRRGPLFGTVERWRGGAEVRVLVGSGAAGGRDLGLTRQVGPGSMDG